MKVLDTYNYTMYNDIVVGGGIVEKEKKSSQAKIDANARYDKRHTIMCWLSFGKMLS